MADEVVALDEVQAGEQLDKLFATEAPPKEERPRGPDGKFLPAKAEEEAPEETPEDAPEVEEEEAEEAPPVRTLKVKVDGIEVDVDEEELKKGYSRTSDYTRKTQALAEERKRFEAEEVATVRAERQAYAERLDMLAEALEALTPSQEPDWLAMKDQLTPEEFTSRYTAWKANAARLEKVKAEQARVADLQQQETTRERTKRLAAELERLNEAIPDLKDPEKGKVLRQDLVAYATSIGFSDDEVNGVEDHRALVLLHKARLWDASQKAKPKLEEKVDRAISALKPSGAKPAPKAKVVDGLRTRLSASGSQEDAAALLNTLMGHK